MPIQITCGGCQTTLTGSDEFAGKRIRCPQCGQAIVIPGKQPASPQPQNPQPQPPQQGLGGYGFPPQQPSPTAFGGNPLAQPNPLAQHNPLAPRMAVPGRKPSKLRQVPPFIWAMMALAAAGLITLVVFAFKGSGNNLPSANRSDRLPGRSDSFSSDGGDGQKGDALEPDPSKQGWTVPLDRAEPVVLQQGPMTTDELPNGFKISFPLHPSSFACISFNDMGRRHVVYDLRTGKPTGSYEEGESYSSRVALNQAGDRLAIWKSGSSKQHIQLVDVTRGERIAEIPYDDSPLFVDFIDDERLMVVRSTSLRSKHGADINIHNLSTERSKNFFAPYGTLQAEGIAVSPNGKYLFLVFHKDMRLFHSETGRCFGWVEHSVPNVHSNCLGATFSLDGSEVSAIVRFAHQHVYYVRRNAATGRKIHETSYSVEQLKPYIDNAVTGANGLLPVPGGECYLFGNSLLVDRLSGMPVYPIENPNYLLSRPIRVMSHDMAVGISGDIRHRLHTVTLSAAEIEAGLEKVRPSRR